VKKLVIVMIAAMALSGIAIFSATAQSAQSNQYSQLQSSAAAATDPLIMDSAPSLNQDSIRQVQQALQKKGFDPGPVDGLFGPKTKEAVRNFQDRYGMNASGDIDNQTLFALGIPELAGAAGSSQPAAAR
jgi:peptidoglycan hydrolase-like protein with peptidoglycan-binding domain